MVSGMVVVVLHGFCATRAGKLSYSRVNSVYTSIKSECVCASYRERKYKSKKAEVWRHE